MEIEYKEAYKIDNETQLNKALKYLGTLGYEWNSGRGLTDWKPDTTADDFPIVLTTGTFGKPNTLTYGWSIAHENDYKPPFDNILDAPDYSGSGVEEGVLEEIDSVTEEGYTASEIFSEFLGELSELLGLTEDGGLAFDDEPEDDEEEKDATYTVRLTDGESIYIRKHNGGLNADFVPSKGDTDRLTAKQLFMYLTGEEVEAELFMNGKCDIRQGIDDIKTIEVDGTHKTGEFESDVRFTVIADGKHVTIDHFLYTGNDYHLFELPFIYDGNELTFDELLAFTTREGDVGYCDNFEEIQSISIVTHDKEDEDDKEDEETSDSTCDESDETRFVIRLTNRRVVWRVPNDVYMDIAGPMNGFELKSKEEYSINPYWDYHLTVGELAEALSLINLSELASISIVD